MKDYREIKGSMSEEIAPLLRQQESLTTPSGLLKTIKLLAIQVRDLENHVNVLNEKIGILLDCKCNVDKYDEVYASLGIQRDKSEIFENKKM